MQLLIALALGLGSAFAFQPYALWPLMPLAFVGLFELIARAPTLRRSLLIGWLFGVGQFVVGLNWIATAFTFRRRCPLGWDGSRWCCCPFISPFIRCSASGWRGGSARDQPVALVLALAGGWAITEWLRATMFTGFAWNPVGVSSVDLPNCWGKSLDRHLSGSARWWC